MERRIVAGEQLGPLSMIGAVFAQEIKADLKERGITFKKPSKRKKAKK